MKNICGIALAVWLPLFAACSSDDGKGAGSTETAAGSGGMDPGEFLIGEDGDAARLRGGSGGSGASGGDGVCGVPNPEGTCTGTVFEGESIPLDIYIMFDQSGSMCSCLESTASQICPNPECLQTRLDAVRAATELFLQNPESARIGVGLGHFGNQPIGQASCNELDYEAPSVTMGTLPEHASSIMEALNRVEPTGETPTGAAIRGACTYARSWKESVTGHKVVILLLTDGKPEAPATCQNGQGTCCPSLDDAAGAAATCLSESGIPTYVLGVGPLLENLEQIAVAGGTEHAYLVEGGDVSARVLDALNRIRGDAAIPCRLRLPEPPDGLTLKLDEVNLEYQSASCDATPFYSVQSAAECGAEDGWYYDDPANPASIELCPRSCGRVSAPEGSLFFSVGCATQYRIR